MHIVRRIFVALLAFVLPFLLFWTAFDYGVVNTAGNPAKVKKIIADSGVYQNIIPSALDQAQQKSEGSQAVSLTDPAVKSAAERTFSPQFLQQSTENVIDGVYRWLDGTVSQPDFKIDMSGQKTELASLVAAHAKQVAAGLPACSLAQTEAMARQGSGFDVFSAKCLPIGVTPGSAAAEVKSQILKNKDFLKDPVVTAATIKAPDFCSNGQTNCKSNSNTPLFQTATAKKLPGFYQWAKRSPFILGFLSLLVMAGLVFISSSRRKGLRRAGVILLSAGLFLLVLAWGLNYGVTKQALPKLNLNNTNASLQKDIKALITDLEQAVDRNYWLFGGVYTVLGAAAVLTAWKYRRPAVAGHHPAAGTAAALQPETEQPAPQKSRANRPKPKKPAKTQ